MVLRGTIIALSSRLKKRISEQTKLENKIKELEREYQQFQKVETCNTLKKNGQKWNELQSRARYISLIKNTTNVVIEQADS